MDENKNIDKLFQSAISRLKMDPPDETWNSIDAELARKQSILFRKKANRFRLLSIILAFLLISFITYHFLTSSENSTGLGSAAANSIKVKEKSLANSGRTGIRKTDRLFVIENPSAKTSAGAAAENLSSSLEKKEVTMHRHENNPPEQKLMANAMKKPSKRKEKNLFVHEKPNRADDEHSITGNQITDSPGFNDISILSTNYGKQVITPDKPVQPFLEKETGATVTMPDKEKSKSLFSVSVFYSPRVIRNHLKSNISDAAEIPEYQTRENPAFAYNAGILARYDLKGKWSIVSGFSYSTLSYSITLPTMYAKYGLNREIHYQYPTSCGVIEIPNAANATLHDGDSLHVNAGCTQSLQFINIPLMVRFGISGTRIAFYATGGFSADFMIREKAKITMGNSETTIINNIEGLKKINYSVLFGIGLQYNFYNGIGIFMEPAFRGSITSLTEHMDVNCYPYSFGLNTGISFHF